jgi:hypothetical protein
VARFGNHRTLLLLVTTSLRRPPLRLVLALVFVPLHEKLTLVIGIVLGVRKSDGIPEHKVPEQIRESM